MAKRNLYILAVLGTAVCLGIVLSKSSGPQPHSPASPGTRDLKQSVLAPELSTRDSLLLNSLRLDSIHMSELARGVKEQPMGSNDGPRIRMYQKATGAPAKSAWCASYAYWVHHAAELPAYRSASCQQWSMHGEKIYHKGIWHRQAMPGDWILFWGAKQKRYTHITSIHALEGDYYITIGGNESNQLHMGRTPISAVTFIGTYNGRGL